MTNIGENDSLALEKSKFKMDESRTPQFQRTAQVRSFTKFHLHFSLYKMAAFDMY